MAANVFGIRALKIDGEVYSPVGNVNYNLGGLMREGVAGATGVDGYKETPEVPFAEFEIRDRGDLSLQVLKALTNATVTVELRNGKVLVFYEAWVAGSVEGNSEEGNIQVRIEALRAEEVTVAA